MLTPDLCRVRNGHLRTPTADTLAGIADPGQRLRATRAVRDRISRELAALDDVLAGAAVELRRRRVLWATIARWAGLSEPAMHKRVNASLSMKEQRDRPTAA